MKIALQTWGSQGDINPFIALSAALVERGHEVSLAITSAHRKDYNAEAEKYGFTLYKTDFVGESEEALEKIAIRLFKSTDPMEQLKIVCTEMLEPSIDGCYQTALELCETHDLIIGHFFLHAVAIAAEKTNTPYISVSLNHGAIPSAENPPAGLPNLGKWFNKVFWKLAVHFINKASLPYMNRLRLQAGLPEAHSYRDMWESKLCNLIAVSPLICSPKSDWEPYQKVCGLLETRHEASNWQMPAELETFLQKEPAPVYMTFGSAAGITIHKEEAVEAARLLTEAAKIAKCRAIVQAPWEIIEGIEDDPNIYRITASPYDQIFPRCAAVVHHGGSGTTQTTLLCGKPSVVVAHINDQLLFGMELHRLGVAPKLLKRQTVTPNALAKSIETVLNHPEMQQRAQQIGNQISKENGAQSAVDFIEEAMANLKL